MAEEEGAREEVTSLCACGSLQGRMIWNRDMSEGFFKWALQTCCTDNYLSSFLAAPAQLLLTL